jgi:hypothetical protein
MGRQAIERNLTMGSESPSAALGPSGKPEQTFSGVSLDPLIDSDPRS